jgi:hypothetical protein
MKKLFTLTMLISLAMICSCQKQDSAAERQLAQRKAELDAREKALDEREKALAERERATTNIRPIPAMVPRRTPDAAQVKAERDRRIQQLPPDAQRLLPDPAQVQALRDKRSANVGETQEQNAGARSPAALSQIRRQHLRRWRLLRQVRHPRRNKAELLTRLVKIGR